MPNKPIIYAISGLGADARVFDFLKLPLPVKPISWVQPYPKERVESYATRLINQIDTSKPFILLGVSFGGLIAVEIAKKTQPLHTYLISSCENRSAFPLRVKLLRAFFAKLRFPVLLYKPPKRITTFLFKAKNKQLLYAILDDTDPVFARWAVHALLLWANRTSPKNYTKVQGSQDFFFPAKTDKHTHIIKDGGHFMIVDKAEEVSGVLSKAFEAVL
jgi:pimeloyl-ACP methyl ester carboxylesterase